LAASELFGYLKGAFSGAQDDRPGLIRTSDHGTLFLDEIGDLAPDIQAALLRVLQEHEVHPLGASKPVAVDLRVVAATHRDVHAMSRKGDFRSDLLARLTGFTLELPALRARREDLGILISVLLQRQLGERAAQVSFGLQAARTLMLHPWPLNVRQLAKTLEVATALADDGRIEMEHLPPDLLAYDAAGIRKGQSVLSEAKQRRRDELIELLRTHNGNVTAVARDMGKARAQIQRWIKLLGIDAGTFRGAEPQN
jgi:DNA-binding NtrC family response regulator